MAKRLSAPIRLLARSFSNETMTRGPTFTKAPQPSHQVKPYTSTLPKLPPLSSPLESLPVAQYAIPPKTDPYKTHVTTLKSGIKVASEAKFGEYCTIGVVIDAGSRYEVAYPSGICHFLEKLAFNSTEKYETREEVYSVLENYGGICDAQITKDTSIYAASCHISGLDEIVGLIADAVLRPRILTEELDLAREVVKFDIQDMNTHPESEQKILTDWIHAAAYRDNTLGLARYCPIDNVPKISREMLFSFLKTYFAPQRMAFAGVGVNHEDLEAAVKRYFEDNPAAWTRDPKITISEPPGIDKSVAQYTGGLITIEKDLSNISMGPNPYPDLAHVVLGLESCSYMDDDFVTFCVLNSIMGGGSSFSAGGPGKGMYTRLYLNVLNKYNWMNNATAYNHVYADSGIFCIHASSKPSELENATNVVIGQFLEMAKKPEETELERAKTQLNSMLMMNLEQRPVMFEDVGRQVLGHGHRKSPMQYMEEIEQIGAKDIQRVAERLLASKASVVGYGDLQKLPEYGSIDQAFARKEPLGKKKKRFSLFG